MSTTSTLGGDSSGGETVVLRNGGSTNHENPGSTIAFGLMSTMAVRPLLEHVAPDQMKEVDVALNEIRTTASSVYGGLGKKLN